MKINSLIICLLLVNSVIYAQPDFRSGYVIDFSGDTLFGDIDYRGDLLMGSVCKIKISDEEIIEYSPYDIMGFRFIDSKYFVSKEIAGKMVFLEYLINGKISIYYLRDEIGDHYYIDKEGLGITELPYEEGIKRANLQKTIYETLENEEIVYNTTIHMGLLKIYMQDYPEIFQRIEDLNKPDHVPLIKLAEKYHFSVCPDEQCLIYEKKLPLLKVAIEPYWGMYVFHGSFDLIDNTYIAYGGNLYLSIPRANEKISFKFGFESLKTTYEEGDLNIQKFPIQIQYIYPSNKFKPKTSFGFNFWRADFGQYFDYVHTICFNAGFNLELTKRMSLSVDLESEITPLVFIIMDPNYVDLDLLSGSLKLGLFFDL